MNKILQILLGLLVILVLAYISFLDLSSKIKDDLLLKTKTTLADNGIVRISVKLEGEDLRQSRTIILTGIVSSEKEKIRIASLVESLEGVCAVNNQMTVDALAYSVPLVKKVEAIVPLVKKAVKPVTLLEPSVQKASENKEQVSVTSAKNEETVGQQNKIKIPVVPMVPTPIKVIAVPTVVEVEKTKLEGVK